MATYGVSILNEYGYIMKEYYFPDEIIEAHSDGGGNINANELEYILYTITQPMDP